MSAPNSAANQTFDPEDIRTWPRLRPAPMPPPPLPALPFAPLPPLPPDQTEALRAAALHANDRYLADFVEAYGFCPYARKGRRLGQVFRYVHYASDADARPLVHLLHEVAADRRQLVVQVIVPLVEVGAEAWTRFCAALVEHGNCGLERDDRLATAALHPKLNYREDNPFSLLTLFRRAPDPTIQWVRMDAVRALYAGRDGGTRAVSPEEVDALLARPPMTPLYDRIAHTNAAMARRLRVAWVEELLAGFRADAQREYQRILLDPRFDETEGA
ncbi:MAG: hypothetical protein FJ100_22235 [Deltaproteobacteria bacterium]|nr:hypothetical protein [Deltaproteobacteria bacterium]